MIAVLKIVAFTTLAAIGYGLVLDQVTIRICEEYFTVFHPQILPEGTSKTVLALAWGVVATWWAGLLMGVPLALCMRIGRRHKLPPADAVRPVLVLLAVMAVVTTIAALTGNALAASGEIRVWPGLAEEIPKAKHVAFLTDLSAHNAAYGTGFLGGFALWIRACWKRGRLARRKNVPESFFR